MKITQAWENLLTSLEKFTSSEKPVRELIAKTSYFLVLLIVIPLLFYTGKTNSYTDVKIGSVATKRVVAPFNFFILKTKDELATEHSAEKEKVPYYFSYKADQVTSQLALFDSALTFIKSDFSQTDNALNDAEKLSALASNVTLFNERYPLQISSAQYLALRSIFNSNADQKTLRIIEARYRTLLEEGILDISSSVIKRSQIAFIKNDVLQTHKKSAKVHVVRAVNILSKLASEQLSEDQAAAVKSLLNQVLAPNLIYSQKLTDEAIDEAVGSVSLTKDMVFENERIVDANERIDEEIYQKLYSLEFARVQRSEKEGNWQPIFAQIGKIMLLAAILFIVGLYLFSFRNSLFLNNRTLLLITLIILFQSMVAWAISGPLNWPVYMIPTTIASMLLAILIDSGIAFVVTIALGLIFGGLQGGGYDITLMTVISGMVSIYSVHEIRNRNQIFKAILYIAISYIWIIAALTFLRFDTFDTLGMIFVSNLLPNAIFAPFITYMMLGIFEKLFDITTDVRLLELSDLNHPLLKELSIKAPGTFHHSMVVGNLAEAGAKEIGENSLLVRVGSYFHDIGKMEKPEYFIENQQDSKNQHSKLKPHMSALILASHVKNGLEMAKEHNLPRRLCDFIAEHHGTNLMYFFYNKAVAIAGDKDNIKEDDFRYPGPKPQTKATAIVMLADTVEAATRTLKNPSPSKIRAFVEGLVDKKYQDGELDECDLTFKELGQIIDGFMPVLYGVFQHRVEYDDTKDLVQKKAAEKKLKHEK